MFLSYLSFSTQPEDVFFSAIQCTEKNRLCDFDSLYKLVLILTLSIFIAFQLSSNVVKLENK